MKMRQTPPQSVTVRSEAQLHDFTQEETITAEVETPHFSYCHGSNRKSIWGHLEDILLLNKFFFQLSICALLAKL